MHFAIGMLGLAVVLTFTFQLGEHSKFSGVFHGPSAFLLALGPICMAIAAYKGVELWDCLKNLWRAMRFNAHRSRAELYDGLTRFAAELRGRRPAEALQIADSASHPLFRQLGPLVVRQYEPQAIEDTSSTAVFVLVSTLKRSEDVLLTLARVAPATGLVGTVMGLITLLKDLSNFNQLGPSMALALLCTLYGLVLANAVYTPLAKVVHNLMSMQVEEARLLTRGLVLVAENKPLSDVRKLFESTLGGQGEAPPSVDVALGGGR